VKVKICGITNLADAIHASDCGADLLGFIFYPPSKRSIDLRSAAEIASQLRQREHCPLLVGVFVDETPATMARILDQCRLDLAQLSGDEVPSFIGDAGSPIYGRSYKALRPTSVSEAEAESEWYLPPDPRPEHPALLVDTYHPTLPGGTGETGDWSLSAQLAQTIPGLMLAGGLTAGNVAQAIDQVRPFGVDVASGVEFSPGVKDPHLVSAFIRNAKPG
jgi:phosphoribosylanthranilate isomerase